MVEVTVALHLQQPAAMLPQPALQRQEPLELFLNSECPRVIKPLRVHVSCLHFQQDTA